MKFITILALGLLPVSMCFGDTPVQIVDGVVKFAVASINGTPVFSRKEADATINSIDTSTGAVLNVEEHTPSAWEVMLSTSARYSSYSDFQKVKTIRPEEFNAVLDEIKRQGLTRGLTK